jgi:cell division protein FtsA
LERRQPYTLKVPHAEAERIKINHGSVLAETLNQNSHITVQGISGTKSREVPSSYIAKVLGARAEELFSLIREQLEEKELTNEITGGIVLTGGGALIKGLPELGEYIIEKPTKVGYPAPFGGMTNIMQNPKYSTVLGLLLESCSTQNNNNNSKINNQKFKEADIVSRLGDSLRSVFKEIF